MIKPKFPENEKQRQAAVEKYELLDSIPESSYDNITDLMAYICDTPIFDKIPEEHLESIFDLFTIVGVPDRNGNVGTGIGLATVKKLTTQLGGSIEVSSKIKEGSIFTFTLSKY